MYIHVCEKGRRAVPAARRRSAPPVAARPCREARTAERVGADGRAGHRAVGRVAPFASSERSGSCRRRARRRLLVLSPLPCPARRRVRGRVAGASGAIRRGGAYRGRAGRRLAAAGSDTPPEGKFRGPRHRPRTVRAGPKLGCVVARARPAAAAGRGGRHRLRRRILVRGVRAVGEARRRHRQIARRAEARQGARRTARA